MTRKLMIEKYELKENRLIKHSAAVHISNEITVLDRKLYNLLMKNAYHSKRGSNGYLISILDITKELGHKDYKNYEFIVDTVKKLVNTSITFNLLKKDKKQKWAGTMAMLSEAIAEGGSIRYAFPSFLEKSLFSPNIYASLNLEYQKKLNSKYSLALWEFCTEQLDSSKKDRITTDVIEISTIRSLLGANDEIYNQFKYLNSKVFKPAVKEVCEQTDINVTPIFKTKSRRSVVGVSLEIERKPKTNGSNQQEMFKQDEPNIIKLLNDTIIEGSIKNDAMELGISEELIEKSKAKYPLKDLKSALDLLRDKIKANTKIKNLHAYFITLLETGVYDEVSSDELIEQASILEEKQKEAKITNGESRLIPFLEQLKVHFDRNTYRSWILHLTYFKEDKDCIYFKVPTNFIKEWMDNNLSGGILLCLHKAGCNFKRVEFIV